MARTAMVLTIVATSLLVVAGSAVATEVYWTPAHELAPPLASSFLAWGDLDGDGDDDVSALSYRRQLWNTGCPGPLVWQAEESVFPSLSDCTRRSGTLGDVDADGDLDLIFACLQPSLRMVWNVGTPQEPVWQYGGVVPGNPNLGYDARACLGDIDADGDLDLVVAGGDAALKIVGNIGTAQAPYWVFLSLIPAAGFGDTGIQFALGDLDGDGDLDIVGAAYFFTLRCWENVGTPQVWSYVENPAMLTGVSGAITRVNGLALPDVDCDGDPDLLIGTWPDVYLYLNERITPVLPSSWGTIKALYR